MRFRKPRKTWAGGLSGHHKSGITCNHSGRPNPRPVSRAVVSAALLRAPIEEPPVVLLGPADTTWQMFDEVVPAGSPRSSGGALASLAALATAISCLVLALASFQTV